MILPQRWISRIHSKNTLPSSTWLHIVFATRGEETKFLNSCYWNILQHEPFLKHNSFLFETRETLTVIIHKSRCCHFALLTFTHAIRRALSLWTGACSQEAAVTALSWQGAKGTDEGWNLCGEPSGKASAPAALLLPSTTQWGQRVGAAAGRQTHDDKHIDARITGFAGAALLPPASSQTHGWADRGHAVSKTPSKAVIRKISLWLVRWEVQRRMFVVSRVVTTDYMCGPGFIGFLADAVTPSVFTDFRDGANYRNLDVTVVLHSLSLGQNVGLLHFQLKLKGAFTCIIYAPGAPSPALSGRVKGDFLMLWY